MNIIAELKLIYNTQHVIAAGDYNAVLEPEDSSSQEIRKRTTSAALYSMIDSDLARKSNRLEHTYPTSNISISNISKKNTQAEKCHN